MAGPAYVGILCFQDLHGSKGAEGLLASLVDTAREDLPLCSKIHSTLTLSMLGIYLPDSMLGIYLPESIWQRPTGQVCDLVPLHKVHAMHAGGTDQ